MRFIFLLTAVLTAALATTAPFVARAAAEPYTPTDDETVLERLGPARTTVAGLHALQIERKALAQDPADLTKAVAFAHHAIELGRAEADPRYFGYAESALSPWIVLSNPPPAARLLRATLLQQRHDFSGALIDLDVLIGANSQDQQARLTRAVVMMVQGRPADAVNDCNALIAAHADLLAAAVCIAEARSLDGHAEAAAQVLSSALTEATGAALSERLWAMGTLAEIEARRERPVQAEQQFKAAFALLAQTGDSDPYLTTAYADFLLAQGRAEEARTLTRDAGRIDNLLLRQALAQAALSDPALPETMALLQARFAEAALRGGATVHLREEAMFQLYLKHDPVKALEKATQNWLTQREPTDARLLLEASLAAAKPLAARPVLDWMKTTGIEDPALHKLAAKLVVNGAGTGAAS